MSDDPADHPDTLQSLHATIGALEAENRRLREETLVLSERLHAAEANNRADFLADVAHELRTPLTSITGYTALMLDGDTGDLNPTQREFLETVNSNAERLGALINRFVGLARGESSMTANPQPPSKKAVLTVVSRDAPFIKLCTEIGRAEGYDVRNLATSAEVTATAGVPVIVNGTDADVAGAAAINLTPLEIGLLNAGAAAVLAADAAMGDFFAIVENFDTALCISADALTLRQLDRLLHDGGCKRVLRATMEHDGLMLARRHTPPVIILDTRPSGSLAFDTLDSLRADPATRTIPVVALVEPAALPDAPFAAFGGKSLPRPVTRQKLVALLSRLEEAS